MKKFIVILVVAAIVSLGGGYAGTLLFKDSSPKQEVAQTETKPITQRDIAQEKEAVKNLAKTYLYASSNYEWDIVSSLTTGLYKKQLQETIIPNADKLKEKNAHFVFNPKSFKVEVNSMTATEAMVFVDYVINKGEGEAVVPVQEKIKLYLVYQDQKWLIFSVETIK